MRIIIIILGDIFGTQVIKTRSTYLSIYVMFRPRCGFIWIVSVLLWEKLRIEAVAVVHCSHWSMTEVMISGKVTRGSIRAEVRIRVDVINYLQELYRAPTVCRRDWSQIGRQILGAQKVCYKF